MITTTVTGLWWCNVWRKCFRVIRSTMSIWSARQPSRSCGTCPILSGTGQANSNFIEDQDVLPNTSALPSHPLTTLHFSPITGEKLQPRWLTGTDFGVGCHEKLLFPGLNQYGARHTVHYFSLTNGGLARIHSETHFATLFGFLLYAKTWFSPWKQNWFDSLNSVDHHYYFITNQRTSRFFFLWHAAEPENFRFVQQTFFS